MRASLCSARRAANGRHRTVKGLAEFGKREVVEFRDLRVQYDSIKESIQREIEEVIGSSHFIGGEKVSNLEAQLAEYVGVKHCVSCANGTDALQLALMAWEVGPGDAVFVPDFTFFSSGEVVSTVGATPVFVDIDLSTFNMDPSKLEEAISAILDEGKLRPRVVVAVDLFGLPADYPDIKAICEKYHLLLLEDGAQGFGGAIAGQRACSFGDISTTSFFPAKPLGCYGDGGAIFTDNDKWDSLLRSFAVHGKGDCRYDNVRIGMNSRLDALQAGVLLAKLPTFASEEIASVNRVASLYSEALGDTDLVLPNVPERYLSSWAQYTVLLPDSVCRDEVQKRLADQGIPTMVYYPKPMHEQLAFKDGCKVYLDCPNTSYACAHVLSLPLSPYLTEREVLFVCEHLKEILRG